MFLGLYTTLESFVARAQEMRNERGATAAEYGLLIALIAAIIIGSVTLLGDNINKVFDEVAKKIGG